MKICFVDVFEGLYYLKLADKDVHVHNANGTSNITIPDQAIWHLIYF
jgi:hypothetical protein